jgi:hypothetical protein
MTPGAYGAFMIRTIGTFGLVMVTLLRNMPDFSIHERIHGVSEASMVLLKLCSPERPSVIVAPPNDKMRFVYNQIVRTHLRYSRAEDEDVPDAVNFNRLNRESDKYDIFGRYERTDVGIFNILSVSEESLYPHTEMTTYFVTPRGTKDGTEKLIMIYDVQYSRLDHPLVKEMAFLTALSGRNISPLPMFLSRGYIFDLPNGEKVVDRFLMLDVFGMNLETFLEKRGGKVPLEDAIRIGIELVRLLDRLHATGVVHGRIGLDTVVMKKNLDVSRLDLSRDNWLLVDFEHAVFYPERWKDDKFPFRGLRDDVWNVADLIGKLATGVLDGSTIGSDHGYYKWMEEEVGTWHSGFFNLDVIESPLPRTMGDTKRVALGKEVVLFLDSIKGLSMLESPNYEVLAAILERVLQHLSHSE